MGANENLIERVKELSCLYEISSLFQSQDHQDPQIILEKITHVLKKAWRHPNTAYVEINALKHHLKTDEIPVNTVHQSCDISLFKKRAGEIKVHYPIPQFQTSDFLEEEQKLLNKVAHEVSIFLEKIEQQKKEEWLQRSAQRNDRLAILGEITAGIAHELNTPLGNMLGFAEFIEEKTTDPSIKRDSKKIIDAAIFSREVVKKLMFFACEMPQNREHINIKPVVEQALSLLGQNFKKAEVSVKLIAKEDIEAQIDSIQLTQVLFNLLINAIYASPPNSKITCSLTQDEKNIYITIADQGKGIPDKYAKKVFDPFFTTKPVGEGSGLGLSVVHGIIKSHKGSITFSKNKPKGTVFKISIPKHHY